MNNYKLVLDIRKEYVELAHKIAVDEFDLSTLDLSNREYDLLEIQVLNMKQLKDSYLKRVEHLTNHEKDE